MKIAVKFQALNCLKCMCFLSLQLFHFLFESLKSGRWFNFHETVLPF